MSILQWRFRKPNAEINPFSKYLSIRCSPISEKSIAVEGTRVSPACPSEKSSINTKMGIEYWWHTDRGKLGEKPFHHANTGLRSERLN